MLDFARRYPPSAACSKVSSPGEILGDLTLPPNYDQNWPNPHLRKTVFDASFTTFFLKAHQLRFLVHAKHCCHAEAKLSKQRKKGGTAMGE